MLELLKQGQTRSEVVVRAADWPEHQQARPQAHNRREALLAIGANLGSGILTFTGMCSSTTNISMWCNWEGSTWQYAFHVIGTVWHCMFDW